MLLLPEGLNPGSYTPFTADNKLNEKVLYAELERVTPGSGGLHGPAGHSEFASLTFDEWKAWITIMIEVAHKAKIPAWAFLGTESFEKTLPYAEFAIKAGADGIFLINPYFNRYGQEAAYLYYRDFCKEFSDTSFVFYPSNQTGSSIDAATIGRIAEIDNIVGMKLSPDNSFEETIKIVQQTKGKPNFRMISGNLTMLYPFMSNVDFASSCSSMSNFSHEWSLNLWRAYKARDWEAAEKWTQKLSRCFFALSTGHRHEGARAGHKAALNLLGRNVGTPRRPGIPASEEHIARIRKVFEEEGLL
jgi:4-hydroxy-tetrahydrodipicolinate synthase